MNRKDKKAVESLKICIDVGHIYRLKEFYNGARTLLWQCGHCDYEMFTTATEEQTEIINKYNSLQPEKQPIEIRKKDES